MNARFTLCLVGLVALAEPLSATVLFPFVVFMVRGFNVVKEDNIGLWTGLISAAKSWTWRLMLLNKR